MRSTALLCSKSNTSSIKNSTVVLGRQHICDGTPLVVVGDNWSILSYKTGVKTNQSLDANKEIRVSKVD